MIYLGTTITIGTDTQISATANSGYSVLVLSNNEVFMAYSYSANFNLYGMICTISGTTITKATDIQLSSEKETGRWISLALLADNKIYIAHGYLEDEYLFGKLVENLKDIMVKKIASSTEPIGGVALTSATDGQTVSTKVPNV